MTARYHRALTIAGSDSGGGAGIQADLKTFAALGCYGLSVVTAVTAQNTREVSAVVTLSAELVTAQLDAVLADIGADAIKIGMLGNANVIRAVAAGLVRWHGGPVVLDPVMVSKSADRLLADAATEVLRAELLPLAALVTPNLPEAAALLGWRAVTRDTMGDAACALHALGARAVLLKGGHLPGAPTDLLLYGDVAGNARTIWLEGRRVTGPNTHGTGCTLSAAIAAQLARGLPMDEAVARARAYLQAALEHGAAYVLGRGHGPVHHFHALWHEVPS